LGHLQEPKALTKFYTQLAKEYCAAMDEAGVLLYPLRGGPLREPLLAESELKEYIVVGRK